MLNVNSTRRAKRIARDLREALAGIGMPLGHSACLEMSARMLGHPSYGMMARATGGAAAPDDADAPPREVAARRALHAGVLLQAGVPPDAHEAILLKVRPTSRARPRAHGSTDAYGCAWFDGNATSGWCCVAGGEPYRFDHPDGLDAGTTWWTTLEYGDRYRGAVFGPNVLFDKHLTLPPRSALDEHGLDLSEAGAARAAAALGAQVLGRARAISDAAVSASAHRSLVGAFGAGWGRGHGTDDMPGEPLSSWEEFVATALPRHRGRPSETLRMPRLAYARSMMGTEVPTGAYEHVDFAGNPVPAMRVRFVRDNPSVAFVRVLPPDDAPSRCPIRGALWHRGMEAAWLSRPVFEALGAVVDLIPMAAMIAPSMSRPRDFLPDAAVRFLDGADPSSWADGIVAEAIWRSGLSNPGGGSGSWRAGMAAAYLRGVDQARMCAEAVRLHGEGMAVSSFGLGWVRFTGPSR